MEQFCIRLFTDWILPALISILVTHFALKKFSKIFKEIGMVAIDLHKKNLPKLPTSAGLPLSFGILAGLLTYIGIQTFLYNNFKDSIYLLAIVASILLVTWVGFLDDLIKPLGKSSYEMKRRKGKFGKAEGGLPQRKWILTSLGAIPLMVIKAGYTTLSLPFFGPIDFGIFYPLILIPVGFIGASNAINLLGGFNGSEAGMAVVYLSTLLYIALVSHHFIFILFLTALASVLVFLKYNWYPAKFLPGDSLTYLLGAIVASGVIVGNMEKAGIILLMPFILEFFLKARSKFRASSLGILQKDGSLKAPYPKIYSLTHLFMKIKKMKEVEVTLSLIWIEIWFALLVLTNFYLRFF